MLPERDDADYVLVDTNVNPWPFHKEELVRYVQDLEASGKYRPLYRTGNVFLFEKER